MYIITDSFGFSCQALCGCSYNAHYVNIALVLFSFLFFACLPLAFPIFSIGSAKIGLFKKMGRCKALCGCQRNKIKYRGFLGTKKLDFILCGL